MNNGKEIQIADYELAESPEINLKDYWDKLKRRKGTVISVTLAVFILGAFWTFIQKPVYTAKSTILIEKEPNILSFEQVLQVESMRDDFLPDPVQAPREPQPGRIGGRQAQAVGERGVRRQTRPWPQAGRSHRPRLQGLPGQRFHQPSGHQARSHDPPGRCLLQCP